MNRWIGMAVLSLVISACTASEVQQNVDMVIPESWYRLTDPVLVASDQAKVEQDWWTHFGDATLDALMDDTLKHNQSLAIAKSRVEEARAGRLLSQSQLLPQLFATGSAKRENQGVLAGDKAIGIAQANLEASWELDVFGKNQAKMRQSNAILESQEASRDAVKVALMAEVARNYFDMRNYEKQIEITQQNLVTQQKTLSIIQAQAKGAIASDLDVQRAIAQVATTEAQLPILRTSFDAARNRMSVLTGTPPGSKDELLKTPQTLAPLDPQILISAPATVLRNRPDIRAAERSFAASISAKDVAKAQIFPTISLLGLFGVQDSSTLYTKPWSMGVNLTQPLLNFGRIESLIDAADAQEKQAFLSYQQSVLTALEDMENALSSYGNETRRNQLLTQAVASNRKAEQLASKQFSSGFIGLLDVLVAQRNLLDAESALASSDAKLRNDLVGIYAASGGGWQMEPSKKAQ